MPARDVTTELQTWVDDGNRLDECPLLQSGEELLVSRTVLLPPQTKSESFTA